MDLEGQLKAAQQQLIEAEERAKRAEKSQKTTPPSAEKPALEGPAFLRREINAYKDAVRKEAEARAKAERGLADAQASLAAAQSRLDELQVRPYLAPV